jgi:hypothetical protein
VLKALHRSVAMIDESLKQDPARSRASHLATTDSKARARASVAIKIAPAAAGGEVVAACPELVEPARLRR